MPLCAGGPDLYAGVRIDFRGDDVNSNTFLAVLGGDKAAVHGVGTGRVLESGRHDRWAAACHCWVCIRIRSTGC